MPPNTISRLSARLVLGAAGRTDTFTAKLWRRFTHERAEPGTAEDVRWTRVGLGVLHEAGRLGAVLVQFPWSFRNVPENRDWVDQIVTAFEGLPLVLEVRHASWNEPSYYAERVERVHGRNYKEWFRHKAPAERYDYLYSAKELEPWAARTREIAQHPRVEDVSVITNNHARGKGVTNALMLESMVTGRNVEAPRLLFEEYAEVLGPYAHPVDLFTPPGLEGNCISTRKPLQSRSLPRHEARNEVSCHPLHD